MTLLTYGINHKTAPISIREKWSLNDAQTVEALKHIKNQSAMNEAVILSTCNRTEIYTLEENHSALQTWLKMWMPRQHSDLERYAYIHQGLHAVQHIMRVATGLDSMILGEPQIFGQIKQAYQRAYKIGTVGQGLQQLFPSIFSASKTIRHHTAITKKAVSMAYVILQLAKRIFASLKNCRVLFVGSGEMIELLVAHFNKEIAQPLIIAKRRLEKRCELTKLYHHAHTIRIGDIPEFIPSVDIVISATASPLPILGKGMMESALRQRKHRPVLMVDLAVPRDIESEVATLDDVYLYNIDDLQSLIEQNMKNRQTAAKQAEAMVAWQAEHHLKQLRILNSSDMISRYRHQITTLRDKSLQKALNELKQGQPPEIVLRNMAHSLSNKIMHQPTTKLRQAAYDNDTDILSLAKQLFDL